MVTNFSYYKVMYYIALWHCHCHLLVELAVLFLVPGIELVITISKIASRPLQLCDWRQGIYIIFWDASKCSSVQQNCGDTEANQHMQIRAAILVESFRLQGKLLLFKDQEEQQCFSWEGQRWKLHAFNPVLFTSVLKVNNCFFFRDEQKH